MNVAKPSFGCLLAPELARCIMQQFATPIRQLSKHCTASMTTASSSTATKSEGPLTRTIRDKLAGAPALAPLRLLRLVDNSHQHAGHAAMRALRAAGDAGGGLRETHFHATLVTPAFAGMPAVRRHSLVYALLAEEFKVGAASVARTPCCGAGTWLMEPSWMATLSGMHKHPANDTGRPPLPAAGNQDARGGCALWHRD